MISYVIEMRTHKLETFNTFIENYSNISFFKSYYGLKETFD